MKTFFSLNYTTSTPLLSAACWRSFLRNYAEQEKNTDNNVLLVAGSDLKSIKKAYPNYLSDTTEFLAEYSRIILT